jgi:hypothetical protein
MNEIIKKILTNVGIVFNEESELDNYLLPREQLINDFKYEEIKILIPELKKHYTASFMTSLQKDAEINQRWPLINLIRQLLNSLGYKMIPIRKSDGYTVDGVKKYKRFFQITKK